MNDAARKDLVARPLSFLLAWGLPILAIVAANLAEDAIPFHAAALVFAGAFAWMGSACILNARTCHRRHCYYSGPIFLIGAAAILLAGLDIVPPGSERVGLIVNTAAGLVALTFVLELIWGKYVKPRGGA